MFIVYGGLLPDIEVDVYVDMCKWNIMFIFTNQNKHKESLKRMNLNKLSKISLVSFIYFIKNYF